MLKESGAIYSTAADWLSQVVTAGNLIPGKNPASSAAAAKAVLQQLQAIAKAA
jgi:putative intracellular protease/amidase